MASTTSIAPMSIFVLALGGAGPPQALASAPPARARVAADAPALEVKVDPQMFQRDAHRAWIEERGRTVLERRTPKLEPGEHIVVELAGDAYDYVVTVQAYRDGVLLPDQPAPFEHDGTTDELLDRVAVAIDAAASHLVSSREAGEPPAGPEPTIRPPEPAREPSPPGAMPTPRRPLRLRIPGAIATGLGGAMLVSGAVLTARGEQPARNDLLLDRDLRPPGIALLGAGATVLLTGVALLVADEVRCRKQRGACSDRRPAPRRMAWSTRSWEETRR